MTPPTDDELAADRVRRALKRPGAYITEEAAQRYGLRVLRDRRRPPALVFDAAVFSALLESPGLAVRSEGGWRPLRAWAEPQPAEAAGRPGEHLGARVAVENGVAVARRANLTPSALRWLAARKDSTGRPWLTPFQLAAAERLQEDHRLGGSIGRLTMDWRFAPRSGSASATYDDPSRAALDARRRVSAALATLSLEGRTVVERVCLRDLTLREVEAATGMTSRSARSVLQAALACLGAHYGLR